MANVFPHKSTENIHTTTTHFYTYNIKVLFNILSELSSTVFAGVKAAVFSGEKKIKSRGTAYTQQQQNSAVKTSRPFARMGLYER